MILIINTHVNSISKIIQALYAENYEPTLIFLPHADS